MWPLWALWVPLWPLWAVGADRWPKDDTHLIADGDRFPYIVVGGGAAGIAVAARVAQRGSAVLLIEAGGDPSLLTRIPGAAQSLLGSKEDWQYATVGNNVSCLSSRGRACRFSRGKCLGGSTSINYMMYVRGHRTDFTPVWAKESLLPYMLHYEGLRDGHLLPPTSQRYHNTAGIMDIGFFADSENAWFPRIVDALRSLGFPYNRDVNARTQIGVSEIIGFTYDGERMSTARAYLRRSDVQRNLVVMKNARVTSVIMAGQDAQGVVVVSASGKWMRLYAEEEVVLSAGTIGTTQILLQSGIGPAQHLQRMNISVRADLPIGRGVTDHVLPLLFIPVERGFPLNLRMLYSVGARGVDAIEYLATKEGPLASNGLTQLTAFLNTRCFRNRLLSADDPECDVPDAQLIFSYIDKGLLAATGPLSSQAFNLDDDTMKQLIAANLLSSLIVVSPVVLAPRSVGYIELASNDPLAMPRIFPNYLGDERDLQQMLANINVVQNLAEALNSSLLRLSWSDCNAAQVDYWSCYSRRMTYSVFHAVGATSAAVDSRMRVRGVRGLRVADASVLNNIPHGNTAAIVIGIGEMLAHYIKEEQIAKLPSIPSFEIL